jgi:hypothetical protein
MAIWYILWSFGIFFPVLVFCTEKNPATLSQTRGKLMCVCVNNWSNPKSIAKHWLG